MAGWSKTLLRKSPWVEALDIAARSTLESARIAGSVKLYARESARTNPQCISNLLR
jgi:hypothetical protein